MRTIICLAAAAGIAASGCISQSAVVHQVDVTPEVGAAFVQARRDTVLRSRMGSVVRVPARSQLVVRVRDARYRSQGFDTVLADDQGLVMVRGPRRVVVPYRQIRRIYLEYITKPVAGTDPGALLMVAAGAALVLGTGVVLGRALDSDSTPEPRPIDPKARR